MRKFVTRHQGPQPIAHALRAGIGAILAIGGLGALASSVPAPLMMAAFGASCVLLFSVPASPLSQPANVIGGHALTTLVGLCMRSVLPDAWWAAALAVGIAIGLMAALRVTHPPAGANPLVVFATDPGFRYLAMPVLSGAVMLVMVATLYHRATGTPYPMRHG